MSTARVEEVIGEYYEVEENDYGRSYPYHPASVILKCDCGERCRLTEHCTRCPECGAEYYADVTTSIMIYRAKRGGYEAHPWKRVHSPAKLASPV